MAEHWPAEPRDEPRTRRALSAWSRPRTPGTRVSCDAASDSPCIGRELGPWGAEEYLQVKQVYINLNEQPIGWY